MNFKKTLSSLFKNLKKEKVKIIIFSLLLLSPVSFAFAGFGDPVVKGVLLLLIALILGVIALIGFILGTLSKIILSMLTEVVRWAAVAKIGNLSLTKRDNPFIDAGLKVTMPLANMAFILIFVVIAIATILGIESYGLRKILPVLIIMVLLVNFAPVLVGIMVDAGNLITYYFIKGIDFTRMAEVDQGQLGVFVRNTAIAFAGTITKSTFVSYINWALTGVCTQPGNDACADLYGDVSIPGGIMLPTLYLAGSAAAMVIAAVTLIMAIAMFLVRNVVIWLLVILSPLAFAAYVLPSTKKAFSSWWRQLLQWAFIGVTMSFFLYLATVMSITAQEKFEISAPTEGSEAVDMIASVTQMLVKTSFPAIVMVIGLFLSAQGGNKFAGIALKQANKIGNWSKTLATGAIAGVGGYTAGKLSSGARGFFGKEGTRRYELAKRLEGSRFVPIKPGTLTGYRPKEVAQKAKEYAEEFKTANNDRLHNEAKALLNKKVYGKDRIARAKALVEQLTERGELKSDYAPIIRELERQGQVTTAMKAMKKNPALAIGTTIKGLDHEELFRRMSNAERSKIQHDAYENPEVARAALDTVFDDKAFNNTISDYRAARNIGRQLAGSNINNITNQVVARKLREPSVQRKMGITIGSDNKIQLQGSQQYEQLQLFNPDNPASYR